MHLQEGDFALVVGIDDYPQFGANGSPLRGAVADARAFARWLTDRDTGGGLPDESCELVVSTPAPLAPLKTQVDDALDRLWQASAAAPARRRFYFYFSGHGHAEHVDAVSLCLANWSHRRRHAALSSRAYRRFFHECMHFEEIAVFLDCCRLRQIAAAGLESELDCVLPADESGAARTMVAFATEFQRPAFEDPAGGDDAPVRGHFTTALIEGLRGAAPLQPGGGVAAQDLKAYLEVRVPEVVDATGKKQQVEVLLGMPSEPPVVLGAARPEAPDTNCVIDFAAGRTGPVRLESPTLEVIREGPADTGPWRVALEPGWHHLADLERGDEHFFARRPGPEMSRVEF